MNLDLVTLSGRLARRELSAVEVVEACLARIERAQPALNAFREVDAEGALAAARASDRRAQRLGPLDGVPVAVKANIDVEGLVTRSGLGPRGKNPATQDAAAVGRLRAEGAIILGHTNMHEGALGATNDNPHDGRTHNPRRHGCTPGGSSGGSAAAVAANLCSLALGTDTMGSVRLPAAYCGIAGFKPTRGLIDNGGVEPLCRRLDQVGPLAGRASDLAVVFATLTGQSPHRRLPEIEGMRIGCLAECDQVALDDDVRRAFENSLYRLQQAGAELRDVSIAGFEPGKVRRAGLLLAEAEAAAHFAADRLNHPEAFSSDFTALLDYGAHADRSRLADAERRIDETERSVDTLFDQIDLLALPTAPQTAFPFSETAPENQADLTVLASVAGAPAISLPIPSVDLPVGLQLVGRHGADALVLAAAVRMELELGFVYQDPMDETTP
ncbi:MAG: amidase [Alphaproteobacteria bacterium]